MTYPKHTQEQKNTQRTMKITMEIPDDYFWNEIDEEGNVIVPMPAKGNAA